ncbi:MAG TPA: efflux RND transporter permease subunit [Candidatus Paceibacterota bacterium]|nr:efflux RND transporter permease subunit [Candidatus Pacearchaeota archaeon]HRZ50466.1 efflux RND transporter permease subunit [Candidatus Paceibacterota bacterium]HSA36187.1 efflux RND transporter permease subunit [Candidatus Paceibacterota bacterium]
MSGKSSSDYQYLNRLEFKPELKKTWLNFFVSRFRVVILLILLITAWGLYSYFKLPRESNPEVKIPIAVVSTVFPGASPTDIEELITKKVETKISGLKGVDSITSYSSNSVSTVVVEFDAKEDLEDSIRSVRDSVSTLKNSLPENANDPVVNQISLDDTPILTVAVSGPYDGFALRDHADNIKDELEKISGVREVMISGGDQKEISVSCLPEKLRFYGVSVDQVTSSLAAANLSMPSGNFDGGTYVYSISADARVYDAEAFGQIPIAAGGTLAPVYLKDVAEVKETAIKKTAYSRISSAGQAPLDAVEISIVKRAGGNIIETADAAKLAFDSYIAKNPGLRYDVTLDQSDYIREDFDQLTHDFILTIFLVMGVLLLMVGFKEAFVAGLAIPLVFFVSFGVMSLSGITMNFLSTFALLLSLGLIVDDAIVVVSATKMYMRTGKFTPEEAILLVLNDFKVVLTATTLTTVWAFLPLLFSSGIMGIFIRSVPIVLSVTLISSLAIALMVNHPLAAVLERVRLTPVFFFIYLSLAFLAALSLLAQGGIVSTVIAAAIIVAVGALIFWYERGGKKPLWENRRLLYLEAKSDELIKAKLKAQSLNDDKTDFSARLSHGIANINAFLPLYEKHLAMLIDDKKKRKFFLAAVFGLFLAAAALPILGIVKTEFFPADDFNYLTINIEAPIGYKLEKTGAIVSKVEEKLLAYKEIKNFSTVVGGSAATDTFTSGSSSSADTAGITINLVPKSERKLKSYELGELMRNDFADIKDAKIVVTELQGGPPSGSAFEADIMGDDLDELTRIANDLKPRLEKISGVINADISLKEAPPEYTFILNQQKLAEHSLNAAYVGAVLRSAVSGTEATTVFSNNKEISVNVRFDPGSIPSLNDIQNLQIVNLAKQPVYLKDVADIKLVPSVRTIERIDQKRTVVLSSDVAATANANLVLSEFQSILKNDYKLPQGYEISYGGQNEENANSVMSILLAMIVAFVLIITTLVIQFNSFIKALIVLITVPLALIGTFIGMALTGITLSFPGLIGILALFGIVVKNAIILIDKIGLNLKSGIAWRDSIIDAGKSRLEAIFITSFCTILGIVPITLSSKTWEGLGAAIIFGLSISSFFTLFVIPALFAQFLKEEK